MRLVILEAESLGKDMDLSGFSRFGEVTVYEKTTEEECPERVREADIVICNKVRMCSRTLSGAENLKLICVTATGINNIDLDYVKRHNIAVTNVAGYSTVSVAQHTFAMYFYLAEKLRYYDDYVKNGSYAASSLFTCMDRPFTELEGKTWGIIGLGAIGRKVASIAQAFGCRVIYYSTSGAHDDPDYERVDLYRLLKDSDVVSIHAPLNEATENLMNIETFANMKRNAILINVGRGSIVNERDLCCALREGLIAGAALDVLSSEPIRSDSPLLKMADDDRLYITPHIAWASKEARTRLIGLVQKNIASYLEGGMENRVVYKGYKSRDKIHKKSRTSDGTAEGTVRTAAPRFRRMPGFCICFIRCKNERTLFLCNLNFQIIKLQRFNKIILCEPRFRSPFKLRNIRIEPDRLRQIPGITDFIERTEDLVRSGILIVDADGKILKNMIVFH